MAEFLIVYATRSRETQKIADLIAEGIRISGHGATLKNANEIKSEEALKGFDGYVFGSATYHGEMIASMKQLLFIAERAQLKDLPGASFGAFGWSGEAPQRIFDTMANIYGIENGGFSIDAQGQLAGRRHRHGPGLRQRDYQTGGIILL